MPARDEALQDVFQSLILREVVLAEGLQADLERAKLGPKLGELLQVPASVAIDTFLAAKIGKPGAKVAKALTKAAIIAIFKDENTLAVIREARGMWQRLAGDAESTAHSFCRSAICYAVAGDYDQAEAWLVRAEKLVSDLARPNFIRGLMLGAQGQEDGARHMLESSLSGRAKKVTKERIQGALKALEDLRQ
ncbi:hypothetical protein FGE12_12270 [Aggregicoccus sp. 17bor-14]|uniref:tetratricopeptide repeat protein n=1 Tax=Myxococcaceae TaxID=31 RepID=UPI00129CFD37|nr:MULTISPECIES: hypothetical protein [Myxococcaceae]MBF5043165.1 hypothetical protein [Simulacricoccus sp. 17bor-14]MRI88924.1 hypothetical protein [Aggregicoccus sp. 17bor-14]